MAIATGFRTAERKKAKLRLGLAGPAGSGKTVSALLTAYGITGDWSRIGLVDTENGSGELYAGASIGGVKIGNYQVLPLSPPYLPQKYIGAIHMAEQAGLEVIILDSISHAWAGEGGLLDLHGKISSSSKSGNSYAAWREVTPLHNQFVEAMLQSHIHVIATMRSKMEYAIEKDKDGSTTVKKLGMAPVQRDGMDYEFTTVLDLSIDHIASASKDRTSLFDGRYFKPGPDTGKQLKQWLEEGREAVSPTSSGPGLDTGKENLASAGDSNPEAAAPSEGANVTSITGKRSRSKKEQKKASDVTSPAPSLGEESDASPAAAGSEAELQTAGRNDRANLLPLVQVIQKYKPDMGLVGSVACELTGKHSPSELTAEEAQKVAEALEARLRPVETLQ